MLDLEAELVMAAWLDAAVTGILQVEDCIDGELLGDLQALARCVRPRQEWPSEPPVSRVLEGRCCGSGTRIVRARPWRRHGGTEGQRFWRRPHRAPAEIHLHSRAAQLVPPVAPGRLLVAAPYVAVDAERGRGVRAGQRRHGQRLQSFREPACWTWAFTFSRQVPGSVVPWGDSNRLVWVGIRTVPVGWVGALDVIQHIARHIVFKIARLPPLSRTLSSQKAIRHDAQQENSFPRDVLWRRFVVDCAEPRLPLAVGKRVVCATGGSMLGGELDGVKGTFGHCRKKGHGTLRRTFALLAMPSWSVGGVQHMVGSFSYACGFRRPLFSILAAVFAEITAHPVHGTFKPTAASVSEVILALVTLPFSKYESAEPSPKGCLK